MSNGQRNRTRIAASLLVAICLVCTLLPSEAAAQGTPAKSTGIVSEEKVKAAFVIRFLNYVEWPPATFAQPESPYVIGVIGALEVAHELEQGAIPVGPGRRPVVIQRISERDAITGVHVLLIGGIERSALNRLLQLASREPILLITEVESALPRGSMINFRLVEDRVRFEVALEPVEKAGLKLNSRLLSVAMTVIKGPAP